jgi:hypothetical protein
MGKVKILMQMIILINLSVLIPVKYSYGGNPKPFDDYNKENSYLLDIQCKDEQFLKFNRGKTIININLTIDDYIFRSDDAKTIGIDRDFRDRNNEDIYESFLNSIKKYNPDKETAFYIKDEEREFSSKCLDGDFSKFSKCRSKTKSYISAKYGNALIRLSCFLSVKGRTYPILLESKCWIKAGEKRGGELNLTDINVFEETSIRPGIKRLLDEHAKNLSKIFEAVKFCKE